MALHPVKIRRVYWPVSIFLEVWIIMQTWFLVSQGIDLSVALGGSVISTVLIAVDCLLAAQYLSYYQPARGKNAYALLFTVILTLGWLYGSIWVLGQVYHERTKFLGMLEEFRPVIFFMGFLMVGWTTVVSMLWYDVGELDIQHQRQEASEKLARDAELFKLRQQMNPHFLFNSLNSISSLILSRPEQARDMIHKLSDFLRGTLKKEEQQLVTLSEELQYLQLYLDIEKVRFGNRLNLQISCSEEAVVMKLPALLLQPVVENAIKFGLYDTPDIVTIRIMATRMEEDLVITVENPFDAATAGSNRGTGFGLTGVRRRLYLLFARNDLLETVPTGNLYITRIKIPRTYDKSSNH